MLYKKAIMVLTIILLLVTSSVVVAAAPIVDQRGSLSGKVVYFVPVGSNVKEGDVLVMVDKIAGPVPAARATDTGVVTEVLVTTNGFTKIGDVVARIRVTK